MKIARYFFITSIAATAVFACKTPNNPKPVTPVNDDIRRTFSFKKGSYWLYKDTLSGQLDSFFVTKDTFISGAATITANVGNVAFDYVDVYVDRNNSSTHKTDHWHLWLYANCMDLIWYKNDSLDYYYHFAPLTNYPFQTGGVTIPAGGTSSGDIASVPTMVPTFSLNGQLFNNTEVMYHTYTYNGDTDFNDRFCINADVGLIEMDINDKYNSIYKVWQLERWHIVK